MSIRASAPKTAIPAQNPILNSLAFTVILLFFSMYNRLFYLRLLLLVEKIDLRYYYTRKYDRTAKISHKTYAVYPEHCSADRAEHRFGG